MNHLNNDILLQFPPIWRKLLHEIWADSDIGISSVPINILPYPTRMKEGTEVYASRFVLELPYAGKTLNWDVFLNEEDYTFPPDFDFGNDNFLSNPDVDVLNNNVPSLLSWDIENSKSFITVIQEFLRLYKKYQLDRLNTELKFNSLNVEYNQLINDTNLKEDDVEICIDAKECAHILVDLHGKFNFLPIYKHDEDELNPCKDKAMLKLSKIGMRMTPTLYLSPRLEQTLGNASTLLIPTFKKYKTFAEYVPVIVKLLEERVQVIENSFMLKNEYISALLSVIGLSVVEYDNINFSNAAFLIENKDFYCMLQVHLYDKFPIEKPLIVLHSVFNENNGKPYQEDLENYPYSPRWSIEEMVKRLLNYLDTAIEAFRDSSTPNVVT